MWHFQQLDLLFIALLLLLYLYYDFVNRINCRTEVWAGNHVIISESRALFSEFLVLVHQRELTCN